MAFIGAAQAQSIGVQFVGSGTALPSETSAGVTAVAMDNWNTLTGASTSDFALNDDTGSSTTATLDVSGANGTYVGGPSITDSPSGNADLSSGEIWMGGTIIFTLSDIPYSTYDVYVYQDNDAPGRGADVGLTAGATFDASTAEFFGTDRYSNANTSWLAATTTWTGSANQPSPFDDTTIAEANLVEFTGVTASTITLEDNAANGAGGVNGIEIVNTAAVPEPGTFATALCGLGMLLGFQKFRGRGL